MSGAGHGGCPILVEPTQRCDLKGWSQLWQILSVSVQTFNDVRLLYSSLWGFVKKHLQRLWSPRWTSCNIIVSSHSNTIVGWHRDSELWWRYQTQGVPQPAQSKPEITVSAGRSDSPAIEIKDLWRWGSQISLLHPDSWCDTSGVRLAPIPKRLNKSYDQEGLTCWSRRGVNH